jgi:hypothetical protein|tara:strand:+ start:1354 stop:1506 length:153 start_codon:yes stop_codon:yes gene_type:complete
MPIRITDIHKYIFFIKDNTLIIEEIVVNLDRERREKTSKENIIIDINKNV